MPARGVHPFRRKFEETASSQQAPGVVVEDPAPRPLPTSRPWPKPSSALPSRVPARSTYYGQPPEVSRGVRAVRRLAGGSYTQFIPRA